MKGYGSLLLVFLFLLLSSCRADLTFEPMTKNVEVSQSVVYLDTVFSSQHSTNALLKIYNRGNKNILIPRVKLEQGVDSNFELIINGRSSKSFGNIELLAKDSLSVFINVNPHVFSGNAKEYLYTDNLQIIGDATEQIIPLIALLKDAHLLAPKQNGEGKRIKVQIEGDKYVEGFYLIENEVNQIYLTADKPYVVNGYAVIPEGKNVVIEAGVQFYFSQNSGIVGLSKSSIQANGTIENPILFRNDRLDYSYRYLPGQWSGIRLNEPNQSSFQNVKIENAKIGLYINKGEKVILHNAQFYNHTYHGIVGNNAYLEATNLMVANTQDASVVIKEGGNYRFQHATIVNYGTRPNQVALLMDEQEKSFEQVKVQNSLLFSSGRKSLSANIIDWTTIVFQNNALKDGEVSSPLIAIYEDENIFSQSVWMLHSSNFVIDFLNPKQNKFIYTDKMQDFVGKGKLSVAAEIPLDANGNQRLQAPDLGAYQHRKPNEE